MNKDLILKIEFFLENFTTEDKLFDDLSTLYNKDTIIIVFEEAIKLADKKLIDLPKLKENLANRYFEMAKNEFLYINDNYLNKSENLFKKIGDLKMAKKVKELHSKMYEINELHFEELQY